MQIEVKEVLRLWNTPVTGRDLSWHQQFVLAMNDLKQAVDTNQIVVSANESE